MLYILLVVHRFNPALWMGWTTGNRSVRSTHYCVFICIWIGVYPWHSFSKDCDTWNSCRLTWQSELCPVGVAEIGLKQPEDEIQGALRHILPGLSSDVMWYPVPRPLWASPSQNISVRPDLGNSDRAPQFDGTSHHDPVKRSGEKALRVLDVARFLGRTACEGRCERKAMPHWAGRRWSPANHQSAARIQNTEALLSYTPGACRSSLRHLRPVPKYQFLDRTPAN